LSKDFPDATIAGATRSGESAGWQRGHLVQEWGIVSVFAVSSSRQDGVDSPVNRRDMVSIIAQ
jgi:hypothetical protein